ncbi:MAG: transcriptional regulator [Bacteroidota bacterium]
MLLLERSLAEDTDSHLSITLDELVNMNGDIPEEVNIEDKATTEKVKLIQEMDEEDRNMVFKMIDTILTKKKFKDFFQKNVAAL